MLRRAYFLVVPFTVLTTALVAGQTFRAHSDLVVLHTVVSDRRAAAVPGLTRDDFRVFEDDIAQEIRFFVSDDRPVAVGLVLDNSLTMFSKRNELIAAADAFARSCNPADALFTVNFNEAVSFGLPPDIPFTSDLPVLRQALSTITSRGKTALYDAVAAALEHVARAPLEDKVLIVVSDGGDNASALDFKGLLDRAHRSNVVIYAVGVFDNLAQDTDRHGLERIARATGGLALFPEALKDVGSTFARIARDIRQRYMIGYVPSNPRTDAGFRNVRVMAYDRKSRKPLQVQYRPGYFPGM
jgi:Ca-activated chloride channel homolog